MKFLLFLLFLIIIINNIKTYEYFDKKTCKQFENDIKNNCLNICKTYNDKLELTSENQVSCKNIVDGVNNILEKKDNCNNCMWCIIDNTSSNINNK